MDWIIGGGIAATSEIFEQPYSTLILQKNAHAVGQTYRT